MKIKVLITGGTIDKEYDELTGELVFKKSNIVEMLKQARSKVEVSIDTVMLIDSLDMTDNDRQKILVACRNMPEDRVVITHGTDTMVQTAQLLGRNITDKTIVLVGAMIPYAFGNSDALFNLGCAITAVQALGRGVYITMNGKIFSWDNVTKNKKLGEFQATST